MSTMHAVEIARRGAPEAAVAGVHEVRPVREVIRAHALMECNVCTGKIMLSHHN